MYEGKWLFCWWGAIPLGVCNESDLPLLKNVSREISKKCQKIYCILLLFFGFFWNPSENGSGFISWFILKRGKIFEGLKKLSGGRMRVILAYASKCITREEKNWFLSPNMWSTREKLYIYEPVRIKPYQKNCFQTFSSNDTFGIFWFMTGKHIQTSMKYLVSP